MRDLERFFSLLVLFGTAVLLGAGLWTSITFPTVEAYWLPDGSLEWIRPASQAAEQLEPGDHVVQIDGQSVAFTSQVFSAKRPGDSVAVLLERSGQPRQVTLPVKSKSIAQLLVQSSASAALAVAFWAIGATLVVGSLKHSEVAASSALAGAFFALTGTVLALGGSSQFAPGWIMRLYAAGLWCLGPIGLWLHLVFPRPFRLARSPWFVLAGVALGVGGALWGWFAVPDYLGVVNAQALRASYAWLASHVVASIGLITWSWLRHPSPGERRQLGVVALGATLSLTPLVAIVLVPRLLGLEITVDQDVTMLPLVLLPASYGYAIHRYRRLAQDQEQLLMRGLRYLFSAMSVSLVLMVVFSVPAVKALSAEAQIWTAIFGGGLATPIVMALVQALWDLALFGRMRQPLRQAATATAAIDLGIDAEDLDRQVGEILHELAGIEDSAILLLNERRQLVEYSPGRARAATDVTIPPQSECAALFSGSPAILEFDVQRERLAATSARTLLDVPWAQAAIPLRTQRDLIGVLLVGYRAGKPFLDDDDSLILGMVGTALATTLSRRALVFALRTKSDEASLLSQELLRVREDERKRIARDVHDEIIQSLIAVSYGLAAVEQPPGPALRDQVLRVTDRARSLCFELRQFQLDNLGLGQAVRHLAEDFTGRTGIQAFVHSEAEPDVVVPDPVSSTTLGILQEALNNIHRHAQASRVDLWISVSMQQVSLRIRDDGVGFDRIKQPLVDGERRHFGLAMMEERAALAGGQLLIRSSLGTGSEVAFDASLPPSAVAPVP